MVGTYLRTRNVVISCHESRCLTVSSYPFYPTGLASFYKFVLFLEIFNGHYLLIYDVYSLFIYFDILYNVQIVLLCVSIDCRFKPDIDCYVLCFRYHAGLLRHGLRLCPPAEAVWDAHWRISAHSGQDGRHVHPPERLQVGA